MIDPKAIAWSLSDGGLLEDVLTTFQNLAPYWASRLFPLAKGLFAGLAGVEFSWSFVSVMAGYLEDRSDFGLVIKTLIAKIFYLSFFYWLLVLGPQNLRYILDLYTTWGSTAAGLSDGFAPSHFLTLGTSISTMVLTKSNALGLLLSPVGPFLPMVASWIIQLAFVAMAGALFCALIESYIALGAFYAFLAFAASRWTVGLAEAVLAHIFRIGARIFILYLLSSVVLQAATRWADQLAASFVFGPEDLFGLASTCVTVAVLFWVGPRLANAIVPANLSLGLNPRPWGTA